MSKLIKDAVNYLLGAGALALAPILIMPYMATVLTKAEYGLWGLYQGLFVFCISYVSLNSQSVFSRLWFDEDTAEKRVQLLINSLSLSAVISLIVGSFSVLLSVVIEEFLPFEWYFFAVAIISSSLNIGAQHYLIHLQNLRNSRSYVILRLVMILVEYLIIVVCCEFYDAGIGSILIASITSNLIVLTGLILFYPAEFIFSKLDFNIVAVKAFLLQGIQLLPHTIGGVLLGVLDRFVVSKRFDEEVLGDYFFNIQIAGILLLFYTTVNRAIVPWYYGKMKSKTMSGNYVVLVNFSICLFYFAVAGLFLGLAGFVAEILSRGIYRLDSEIFLFLWLSVVFHGFYFQISNYLFYRIKNIYISLATLSAAVLYIVSISSVGSSVITIALLLLISKIILFVMVLVFSIYWYWKRAES